LEQIALSPEQWSDVVGDPFSVLAEQRFWAAKRGKTIAGASQLAERALNGVELLAEVCGLAGLLISASVDTGEDRIE